MGVRRDGRVAAVQILYQAEAQGTLSDNSALFFEHFAEEATEPVREFARFLVDGVLEKKAEIDRHIDSASTDWRIERMGIVERNVLRVAAYELRVGDVPRTVVIDEAISIAKDFGGPKVARFVNGVLERMKPSSTG